MSYRIAVCDDDTVYLDDIVIKINNIFKSYNQQINLDKFTNTVDLLKEVENGNVYKLIFLDILFPQSNGVETAREIKRICPDTDMVFLSDTRDYAVESFDVAPLHYITKPEDDLKLKESIKRFLHKTSLNKITIKTSNKTISLDINSILYFEIMGHDIIIHTADGAEYGLTGTLKEVEDIIPVALFARVHKSFIVNYKYITKIERYKITLNVGCTIPISKQKYNDLQNKFIDYSRKKAIMF